MGKARSIAFGTFRKTKKINQFNKVEKIKYPKRKSRIVGKAKAIAFGTLRKTKKINRFNTAEKN